MSVDLNKNRESLVAAWKDVLQDTTSTDWALFGYEGQTDHLCFISKGDGGIEELKDDLNSGKIMYAFLKVIDPKTSLPKCVLINWSGEGAPMVRKGTCANHIRDVGNLLKGAHVTINARTEEDVDYDIVIDKISKSTGSAYSFKERSIQVDKQIGPVGSNYKRVIPSHEINSAERDMFWQKEEEEEKKRQAEERRKKEEAKNLVEVERRQRETVEENCNKEMEKENLGNQSKSDSALKEAEALIAMRKFDARAVFEKNTSAGQLVNRRGSSHKAEPAIVISPTCDESQHSTQSTLGWPPQSISQSRQPKLEAKCENLEAKLEPVTPLVSHNILDPQETEYAGFSDVSYENGNAILEDYEDLGLRAEAFYDYQAADETEISFDPGDIITHIDQIDVGWWQGLAPDGTFGLFPANYVQLIE